MKKQTNRYKCLANLYKPLHQYRRTVFAAVWMLTACQKHDGGNIASNPKALHEAALDAVEKTTSISSWHTLPDSLSLVLVDKLIASESYEKLMDWHADLKNVRMINPKRFL
jgi:hypothetical protein